MFSKKKKKYRNVSNHHPSEIKNYLCLFSHIYLITFSYKLYFYIKKLCIIFFSHTYLLFAKEQLLLKALSHFC